MHSLPGIVCLHDYYLASLFAGWESVNPDRARHYLEFAYGKKEANQFYSADNWEMGLSRIFLSEWIISKASGLIVHSSWGLEKVRDMIVGPTRVVALPYDMPSCRSVRESSRPTHKRTKLITIGHANENKRIGSVIRAIGSCDYLREKIEYVSVGLVTEDARRGYCELAESLDVNFRMYGQVSEHELGHHIDSADIVSCLRWPVLESASASMIEAMLCGKSTICTDAGFYSSIPDNLTTKISVSEEISDLVASLRTMLKEPARNHEVGNAARVWAEETFSAENYVDELLMLGKDVSLTTPVVKACEQLLSEIYSWNDQVLSDDTFEYLMTPMAIFGIDDQLQ